MQIGRYINKYLLSFIELNKCSLKKRAMSPSIFRRSESSRTSPSPSVRSDEYEEIS